MVSASPGPTEFGRSVSSHGGALRGWRSHRLYVPASASRRRSCSITCPTRGKRRLTCSPPCSAKSRQSPGQFPARDGSAPMSRPETGLAARIDAASAGQIRLRYGPRGTARLQEDGFGEAPAPGQCCVSTLPGCGWTARRKTKARACAPATARPPATSPEAIAARARYRAHRGRSGGVLYGGFSGFLGQGRMELLDPIGPDVWALPCPRALDHTPPGDWTLAFQRSQRAGSRASKSAVGWRAAFPTRDRVRRRSVQAVPCRFLP